MTDGLSDSLRGIVGGSMVVLVGNLIGMGSSFLTRIVAARHLDPGGYGLVVLGVTLLNIAAIVVLLGLHKGLAQALPRSDDEEELFTGAALLSIAVASVVAALTIAASGPISSVFAGSAFEPLLVAFALALPLMVFVELSTGGFRGLEMAGYRVLTKDVLFKGLLVATVTVGAVAGFGPVGIATAWPLSLAIATLGGGYLLVRRTSLLSPRAVMEFSGLGAVSSLAIFSLPLMISGASWMTMQQVDNALIGVFLTADDVGLYDAAYTLATSLLLISSTFNFLFLPMFSRMSADNERAEMETFYRIVTKWMAFAAIPLFLILAVHPDTVVRSVYGQEYATHSAVLAIVATGFFVSIVMGNTHEGIVAIGESRVILVGNLAALTGNVVLNIVLIPSFGIIGAAFASLTSFSAMNLFYGYYLFRATGIHPFYPSLVRPAVLAGGVFLLLAVGVRYVPLDPSIRLGLLFAMVPAYLGLLLVLGGLDREEVDVLAALDEETDVDLRRLIAVMERFAD